MSCPNCGTAENAYFYRRGEEIVGCEYCITMIEEWEAEEEEPAPPKPKKARSVPSVPQERIKIRVLRPIPIFDELQPVVGKVYDAINGYRPRKRGKEAAEFCAIEVAGKKVILRNRLTEEPEYEEVQK